MYQEAVLPEKQLVELSKQVGRVHNMAYQPLEDNLHATTISVCSELLIILMKKAALNFLIYHKFQRHTSNRYLSYVDSTHTNPFSRFSTKGYRKRLLKHHKHTTKYQLHFFQGQ